MTAAPARLIAPFRRYPVAAAALIYALLAVLFVGPALLPGKTLSNSDTLSLDPPWIASKPASLIQPSNPELGDAIEQLQPFVQHTTRRWPHIPLWNPYIDSGRPFLANSQSAVFSIYSVPAYVLGFWTSLGWIAAMKLWTAGFGTFLLGRALGMRFAGALLAGIVFAFSLKMVTWISYPHMSVWALIPWLLWLTDRVVRRPTTLAVAALAVVVALQFLSGHAESSAHALMTAAAFLALRLVQRSRAAPDATATLRVLAACAVALAGGAALAAATLVPFAELLVHSADIRNRGGESIDVHQSLRELIGVFLPDYWGRPTQTPLRPFLLERAMYIGALPLMLVCAALVLRPTATRVWVALWGGLWLGVVVGIPPIVQIVTRLPFFSSGHNSRLIILTILSAALLAGWGMDDLMSCARASARRLRIAGAIAVALTILPIVLVAGRHATGVDSIGEGLRIAWLFELPPGSFNDPIGSADIRAAAVIAWLTFATAGLLLVWLRRRSVLAAAPFAVLAVLLVSADLFHIGMGFNPAIDQDIAQVPSTGAIRYLQTRRPARFAATEEVPQNVVSLTFDSYDARGYDLPILRRYDRLWRQELTPEFPTATSSIIGVPLGLREVTPRALRTLRLLGVTDIMRAKVVRPGRPPFEPPEPFPPLTDPGLRQVYDGADARIYRLEGALPRAFVVNAQHVVDGEDAALRAVTAERFDARRAAVTERELPGLATTAQAAHPAREASDARITQYGEERVVVRARTNRSGLLVLGDTYYPGWKATVDGRAARIEQVDYVFRGVALNPGSHTVEFRYQPLSWRVGWITSTVALLGLLVSTGLGWRARARD